jgi:hypothetical protein
MMRATVLLTALTASAVLAGCAAPPSRYEWGSYEEVIYASYAAHDDVPAEKQLELLEKDYQKARAANKRMPPGWHAHLGYLYYQVGKGDQARQELLTEKAEFPESAVFVDRLLGNVGKPSVSKQ